jgi:hypothetical protein
VSIVPPGLHAALTDHAETFSPLYGGYLSDHGAMASLALYGLTADEEQATAYLADYQQRLDPLPSVSETYRTYRTQYGEAIDTLGADKVLSSQLPGLISGWARDAYHPIIRIAYGYEFGIDSEVAAGLAYLRWCGSDERLLLLAERAAGTKSGSAAALVAQMADCAGSIGPTQNFNQSLRSVVANPVFNTAAASVPEPLKNFSDSVLQIFASTHNFFALHLVTGAHAFRVLYPFSGQHGTALFGLGLLAGYAAAGAPEFDHQAALETDEQITAGSDIGTDEHDIKLAYSAASQAQFWSDRRYHHAANGYLSR